MSLTILIDCDGVLADFDSAVFDHIRSVYGISLDDTPLWDIMDDPKIAHIKDEVWGWLNSKGVSRGLKKYSYSVELIAELRKLGHVICVTSALFVSPFTTERIEWLVEELGFDRHDIMLCYHKHRVIGNVLIDDKPSNVENWADVHEKDNGLPVLWQTPNRPQRSKDERILHTGNPESLIEIIKARFKL